MRKVDLNDETGRHNPFIIRDPCKIFSMSQVKEYMIEKDRESIRTTTLAQRADVLKPPVPTGAISQKNTRSITAYTSMKSTTSNFNSDVL
ncbi:hypothetical protein TVAGG3_0265780, partial [Trichomonas vaginalis G3]|uniref:hypothetical protein n=1 Tax=Trichomonas vaginalis (strain ATCC PRA-98 / G3) TaxID=412133 RepID=UPI0021E52AE8